MPPPTRKRARTEHLDINHKQELVADFKSQLDTGELSDVTVVVEGVSFHIHKFILASRSQYFRALFYGGLKESLQNIIELKDAKKESFNILLKYLYTGCMAMKGVEVDLLLDVLDLSYKWSLTKLGAAISLSIEKLMDVDNVWSICAVAQCHELEDLSKKCLRFADANAPTVLELATFERLPAMVLKELLSRDTFNAPEHQIFKRVCSWISSNIHLDETELKLVLQQVRWSLIGPSDVLQMLQATKTDNSKVYSVIVEGYNTKDEKKERGCALYEVNAADGRRGARIIRPARNSEIPLNKNHYRHGDRCVSHKIGKGEILIDLGQIYLVDTFKIFLEDFETDGCGYYIEVSLDREHWTLVIDYRKFVCNGMQNLRFPALAMRYIKIVGTSSSSRDIQHLKVFSFEAFYQHPVMSSQQDIQVPDENVVLSRLCSVRHGTFAGGRPGNGLPEHHCALGENRHLHWGSITKKLTIAFHQPYLLSSMRFIIRDANELNERIKVQTSSDKSTWKKIGVLCFTKAWQVLRFDPTPVIFIRLTPQVNSAATKVCVQIECPWTAPKSQS